MKHILWTDKCTWYSTYLCFCGRCWEAWDALRHWVMCSNVLYQRVSFDYQCMHRIVQYSESHGSQFGSLFSRVSSGIKYKLCFCCGICGKEWFFQSLAVQHNLTSCFWYMRGHRSSQSSYTSDLCWIQHHTSTTWTGRISEIKKIQTQIYKCQKRCHCFLYSCFSIGEGIL